MATDTPTGSVLLELLTDPRNTQAWERFVGHYQPRVKCWCRRWGAQEADAEDACQTILYKLVEQLQTFQYDPQKGRFRSWLKTVARNTWINMVKAQKPPVIGSSGSLDEARDDWERMMEEVCERELFEEAMQCVRVRLDDRTWQAFQLYVLEGRSAKKVADVTSKSIASVYVIKNRLIKLLKAEIERLDGADHEPPARPEQDFVSAVRRSDRGTTGDSNDTESCRAVDPEDLA